MSRRYLYDVLILHGMSLPLVEDLKLFLESLGLRADFVMNKAAGGDPQLEKVLKAMRRTRLAIILATFDQENRASRQVRPNVVHELTECLRIMPKNLLVMVERDKQGPVKLPSNLDGKLPKQTFQQERMAEFFTTIVKELVARSMVFPPRGGEPPAGVAVQRGLVKFMDRMDRLWEGEFDEAWKEIARRDYATENEYANLLDQYFERYWRVVNALIRKHESPEKLAVTIDAAYAEGLKFAVQVWDNVTKAKLALADKLKEDEEKRKGRRRLGELKQHYDNAEAQRRRAHKIDGPYEQIEAYRSALREINRFIDGLEKA